MSPDGPSPVRARFEDLYADVADPLYAWARMRTRGPLERLLDADDLLQEISWRALGAFDSFRPERGTFRVWMLGIANNVLRDITRKLARRQALAAPVEMGDSRFESIPDAVTTISRRVARDEGIRRFLSRVDDLEEDEKRLVLYRGLEGLSHEDVAQLLAITPDVARKRWQRLVARLREEGIPEGLL